MPGNQLVTASASGQDTPQTASDRALLRRLDRTAALDELKQKAAESGFELLETEWLGGKLKHRFKHVASGKEYAWPPSQIKHQGFPRCLWTDAELLRELINLTNGSGFELLENEWLGGGAKHRFLHTESGKECALSPDHIKRQGFPEDLRTDAEKLEELSDLAKTSGLKLLEVKWLGGGEKHRFLDTKSGKEYAWRPNQIKRNGFPMYLRTGKELLLELIDATNGSGFELLETEWLGSTTKHRFLHIESASEYSWPPHLIRQKGFPKDLKTDADLLQELVELTAGSGFYLLETEWLGAASKHRFLHADSGKEYAARPDNIKYRGFPKDLRTDSEKLQELVELTAGSGFELLETEWLGATSKHRFLHVDSGKEYAGRPGQLRNYGFPLEPGQRYLTQEVCRQAFVHIFGGEFQSNRERLKLLHGKNLELDGYEDFGDSIPACLAPFRKSASKLGATNLKHLQIAFEYQGHPSHREDQRVMERDSLRVQYCKQEGILLVVIDPPSKQNNIRDSSYMYAHVCNAILDAIGQPNVEFPSDFKINLSNWNLDKAAFANLNEVSTENGFEILETEWLGAVKKHRFLHIDSGKEYSCTPSQIKQHGFPKDLSLSNALASEPSSQESQSSTELSNLIAPSPSLYDDEVEDDEEITSDSPMQMG